MDRCAMEEVNKNNSIKYIICIILFFVIGVGIGIIGAKKFLESKKEEKDVTPSNGISDITESPEYQATIEKLHNMVNKNSLYYSTNGFDPMLIDNDTKLKYAFSTLFTNQEYTTETWYAIDWNLGVCANDFLVDLLNTGQSSGGCTIYRIAPDTVKNTFIKSFTQASIDVVEFLTNDGKKCMLDANGYFCGTITRDQITGELKPKFTITKVLRDEDGTITIFDKGYLEDTRSMVVNPDDGIDHYYLHSSDSKDYYYELKSADNLTFVHEFKLDQNRNYYYVKSYLDS